MFTKSKIAAIALTSTLVFASTAQAENVSLEKYVSGMVNQAMEVAQQEIKNNLSLAILTVANNVNLKEEKSYVTRVSIADLKTENVDVSRTEAE
jgi:DNA-binding MltR family transcriptional regulator